MKKVQTLLVVFNAEDSIKELEKIGIIAEKYAPKEDFGEIFIKFEFPWEKVEKLLDYMENSGIIKEFHSYPREVIKEIWEDTL